MRLTIHFDTRDLKQLRDKITDPALTDIEVVELATQEAFKLYFERA